MSSRIRLDAELVRRGLARSREQAAELINGGRVAVAGLTAGKAATQVGRDAAITVTGDTGPEYVSRGGRKLAGALAAFDGLAVAGRRCLDAGASTGGFTDALLRAARGTWSRWTWATASSPGSCAAIPGSPCWKESTSASCGPSR